jgi:hypothetical protein
VRGLWSDVDFLEKTGTPDFNQQLQHTQFADYHGHGWVFTKVYKRDLDSSKYFGGYQRHPYVSFYTGRGCNYTK